MKDWLTVVVTLALIVGGCSQTSNVSPTVSSSSTVAQRPIEAAPKKALPATPKEACGDPMPKEDKAYPVNFYPVFVDYSEANLIKIKQHFCKDAIEKFREKKAKKIIQVASFISEERANQFKEKISQYFTGVDVGTPNVIAMTSRDLKPQKSSRLFDSLIIVDPSQALQQPGVSNTIQYKDLESISKLTKLSKNQVKKLLSIHGKQITDTQVNPKEKRMMKFRVIVPTYLPEGFKVANFEIYNPDELIYTHARYPHRYIIDYRSHNDICFGFRADNGQWGDMSSGLERVKISSTIFGDATLERVNFDTRSPEFGQFRKDVLHPFKITYSMAGGSGGVPSLSGCRADLPFNEAVKIVKSMKYIK